jgi:N-acetylmuramoyl-L-alanine amidase
MVGGKNLIKLYLSASTQEKNIGIDGISEEARMQQLAQDIFKHEKMACILVKLNRPEMTLMQVVKDSNDWRPDFHLALHSNAMPRPGTATGLEALIHNDSIGGSKMADIILPKLFALTALPVRRGKERLAKEAEIDTETKIAEVDKTNAPACLIELFFHDNRKDLVVFKAKYDLIVEALVDGILEYFGMG